MANDHSPLNVDAFRDGDQRAFTATYNTFKIGIYWFCRSYMNQHDAEDITAETFMSIWQKRSMIKDATHLKNLLYTIARGKIIDFLRTSKVNREAPYHDSHQQIADSTDIAALMENQAKMAAMIRRIGQETENLSPQTKAVFKLSFFKGMSPAAIANELDISRENVDNHLSIAKKKLRMWVQQKGWFWTILIYLCFPFF